MNIFIRLLTRIFDLLLLPFSCLDPVYGLVFISILAGIVFLKIFGLVSNQKDIKKVKDKIKAHMLVVVLYRDNFKISIKAVLKLLGYNFVYIKYVLIPLFFMIIIFIFIFGQMNFRYRYAPLRVGEETILKVKANENSDISKFLLKSSNELTVTTPALRINENNEIYWKFKGNSNGIHKLTVIDDRNKKHEIEAFVETNSGKIPRGKYKSWFKRILNPGFEPLKNINAVTIRYPTIKHKVFSFHLNWLIIFFIVSIISGLLFKRFLNVEI